MIRRRRWGMRRMVCSLTLLGWGVGLLAPVAASANPWYRYCRPYRYRRPVFVRQGSGLGPFLLGGVIGAGLGIAVDRAKRECEDDCEEEYEEYGKRPVRRAPERAPAPPPEKDDKYVTL